jgi:hypothetical protein
MADDASYRDWQAQAEVELAGHSTHPTAVQAHYDLSATYLELRYGAMDHADRARTVDSSADRGSA